VKLKVRGRPLPVEVGRPGAGDLLLALGDVEEHGLVGLGPLEVEALLHAVRCSGERKISSLLRPR